MTNLNYVHIASLKLCMNVTNMLCMTYLRANDLFAYSSALKCCHYMMKHACTVYTYRTRPKTMIWLLKLLYCPWYYDLRKTLFEKVHAGLSLDSGLVIKAIAGWWCTIRYDTIDFISSHSSSHSSNDNNNNTEDITTYTKRTKKRKYQCLKHALNSLPANSFTTFTFSTTFEY